MRAPKVFLVAYHLEFQGIGTNEEKKRSPAEPGFTHASSSGPLAPPRQFSSFLLNAPCQLAAELAPGWEAKRGRWKSTPSLMFR